MGEMGEREKENKKDVWAYGATATLYAGATWDCAVAAELEAGNAETGCAFSAFFELIVGIEERSGRHVWMEEEKDRIDALQPSAEMADARYNVWVAPYVIESHAHSWWMSHVTPVFPVMADCFPHTRALLSALGRRYKGVDDDDDDERTLVGQVVALLVDEKEDELKGLLEATYGMDGQATEENVLELMHKHRDDVGGVPFVVLTPTRRPTPMRETRAETPRSMSMRETRPEMPRSTSMRETRPETPRSTPSRHYSPSSSPVLTHTQATHAHAQWTASLPASPLLTSRSLNARASEFRPIQRPLSSASSQPGSLLRADTPSPDLWSHSSPRPSSNLAIAAPLVPPITPTSSLRSFVSPEDNDDDDDQSPFTTPDFDHQWAPIDPYHPPTIDDHDPNTALTDGMTPFDVLTSVFGSSLAPSELEDALVASGYDFDSAIASLVDRVLPSHQPPSPPQPTVQLIGNRITLVSRDSHLNFSRPSRPSARYLNGRPPQGGNRVCRYFIAGECLRADCRFSHDLERALCRFWLRGTCAKNESCEFLHHLPKDVDIASLNVAMSRHHIRNPPPYIPPPHNPSVDDFPLLGFHSQSPTINSSARYLDPSRTRFAAAVKKPPPKLTITRVMGPAADNLHHQSAIVAPRPSPRLKLRPPSLLPTLPTGEAVNQLYMTYRQRALQLGAARNACLSRAADAWRRGDGAAAKRFSREGHDLNAKMAAEMATAASNLVRERSRLAEQAARQRDLSWSDDPGDRTCRGKSCGSGLGVILGIARKDAGDNKLTAEERTECILDLHGLHSNEATEVLEHFLLSLENEHFYGLAYAIVGEEKHTGTQDSLRGASRNRLATGVREWVHRWGYPWSERDGIICIDPLTHASE